jgi:H+/Cl- antiporter ClcA
MPNLFENVAPSLLSIERWKARLVLWLAGVLVGVAAYLFARLAEWAQSGLHRLLLHSVLWPLLLAPVGFLAIVWLTRRYFRGAEGSGIPQTIHALQSSDAAATGAHGDGLLADGAHGAPLLMRGRTAIARVLLACAGLFCGGSIGREGPTVHVGAAIAYSLARWLPHPELAAQRRLLILAGGAAGVAAAFNAPLAGIVFGIEELGRSFEERASGLTLTSVVLAGMVAIALAGDYSYFGQPVLPADARQLSLGTFALALACGLSGGLFSRVLLSSVRGLPSIFGRLQQHRIWFAVACGLVVACVGLLTGGLTYGTGYGEAKSIIESNAQLPWAYAPARAVATLATFLSGVPCGLFAPSLSAGAGLGQMVANLMGEPSSVPFAILGMCGLLAAVTQAPLTSLVIVMEMTAQHQMVFPLMVTVIIATTVSKLLSQPLYHTLAQRYA